MYIVWRDTLSPMFVIGLVVITAIMDRMRRRKGETMSGFSEILTTATVLFLLTLLPVSAILAALLSHRMAANALGAPGPGQQADHSHEAPSHQRQMRDQRPRTKNKRR
jgi:hypothetical protein